jgi:5'-3' exonuclease
MVLCVDSPSWRHDFYIENKPKCPEYENLTYKGHRVKDPTMPWDVIKTITEDLTQTFKEHSDFFVMKVDKAEADDIIAILTKRFKDEEDIWIGSSDKDFIQLQEHARVEIYDPLKSAFRPEQDVALFKKIHNMIGDVSDNILAIKPRVGEKTALKMLKDLPDMLKTDPLMKEKYKFNQNLIAFSKIPCYVEEAVLTEFETQSFNYNTSGLFKIFMQYDMSKMSENISAFKLSDTEVKTQTNQYFKEAKRNAEIAQNNLDAFFD